MYEQKPYSMFMPGRVFAGPDSIETIGSLVKGFSASSVLLVTDQGVWNAGLVDKPIRLLEQEGIHVDIINNVPPEPEIGQVEAILHSARKYPCDMAIGIGGGSAMDTAKIIGALLKSEQKVEDVLGIEKVAQKGLPLLMIPTTAGTGAEATPNAIVTLPEQGLKVGIVSSKLMADCVILDPLLTVKLPPSITASTGIDALAHAVECYTSKKANPFSDELALIAIRLIFGSIRKAYLIGDDVEARHNMLMGSFYAGMCIASSGTTAVHALAYPLGGRYRIPHGVSNAMLLPHVMAFNKDAIEEKLLRIAAEMNVDVQGLSSSQAAEIVIEKLHYLVVDLGICSNLSEYGICASDIPILVEEASKVTRLLDNNAKQLGKDDMYKIYEKLF